MKRIHLLLLSVLSGVLLSLSWPAKGFPFLLLFAFVPLLFVEDTLYKNKSSHKASAIIPYAYLSFLIWNLCTTWWIYYSTFFGAVMAIVFNSLFMALVFFLFHLSRRKIYYESFTRNNYGYLALLAYWVTFEYLHLDWDLSWSWLNLGNGFASYHSVIQWYEYTGTLGGSAWILLSNIFAYLFIKSFFNTFLKRRSIIINGVVLFILVVFPVVFSLVRYYSYTESGENVEVLVVQPNIDPYNEKFSGMTTEEQADKILNLINEKITPQTRFIVAPETALPEGVWIDELERVPSIKKFKELLLKYPKATLVIGASTYRLYKGDDVKSSTARDYPGLDASYDVCNSALCIDTSSNFQVYHKSKLVPGVEKMPFPKVLGFLEKFALNLGGMVGSHGTQTDRTAFATSSGIKVAPVICYESIYGEFVTGYVKNGAQIIFIITNDGWWSDTPGYRQHSEYARLRAIETRRSIARSANTGISSFLNQRGDMFQKTGWWQDDVIVQSINTNDYITFYVKYGDFIARILAFTSALIALFTLMNLIIRRKR